MHLLRVGTDSWFWVDTGPLGSHSDIAPSVGIRHDGVERLSAELLGVPFDEYVGTVGANVGYVRGEDYRRWETPSGAAEVLDAIDGALELLRPFLRLEALPNAWSICGTSEPGRFYRLIPIWLLLGEYSKVDAGLEEARSLFCRREGEVCEQFRAFEKRVRAYALRLRPAAGRNSVDSERPPETA